MQLFTNTIHKQYKQENKKPIQTIQTNDIKTIYNLFKNNTKQYNTITQYKPYKQTTEQQSTIYAKSRQHNKNNKTKHTI